MAKHKTPRYVQFVKEFPMNDTPSEKMQFPSSLNAFFFIARHGIPHLPPSPSSLSHAEKETVKSVGEKADQEKAIVDGAGQDEGKMHWLEWHPSCFHESLHG